MANFNSKYFNSEVFLKYKDTIIDPVKDNLLESGVLYGDLELAVALADQVGGNYITRPMKGLLDGTPDNYDGSTDINSSALNTFSQGIVVIGRAKGFKEKDFTYSITGKDFMLDIAEQVAHYWNKVNQDIMLSILKGIFATALSSQSIAKTEVGAGDILDAVYDTCGDREEHFKVIFMHSHIAKELAKTQLIDYVKYTDSNGITRNTNIATWEGRLVIVNDKCPKVVNEKESSKHDYTCYVLGERAFCFQELPVLVQAEMARDPATNGGEETLYSRERVICQPFGISFKSGAMASLSPTTQELENGDSWELVKDPNGNTTELKTIPFAKIVYTL